MAENGYLERFDAASTIANAIAGPNQGFAQQAKGLVLATGAEIVGTLWNSLTPSSLEWNYRDFLSTVDKDAAAFMDENPGIVNAASLIGGSFIPGGIGLKLMSRARSGLSELGYVSSRIGSSWVGSKQKTLSVEIDRVFRESGAATTEYKRLTRKLYGANVVQQGIDNAIMEVAVVGAMNAHPWLEDYWDDPVKNFAMGVAFGGVLGAGFALPPTISTVRGIRATADRAAQSEILESGIQLVHPAFTNTARYQAHRANTSILDNFINDESRALHTRELAKSIRYEEAESASKALLDAAPFLKVVDGDSEAIKKGKRELGAKIESLLQDDKLLGVDSIKILNLDKSSNITSKEAAIIKQPANQVAFANKIAQSDEPLYITESLLDEAGKAQTVMIRLGTGETFAFAGARNAALAADIPNIGALLKAEATRKNINLVSPVKNWSENSLFRARPSARDDADFLQEMAAIKNVPEDQIPYLTVAPDHLPRLNALIAHSDKLSPEQRSALRIKVSSEYPTYFAQKSFVEKTVSPTYWGDVTNLIEGEKFALKNTLPRNHPNFQKTSDAITGWIHGGGKYDDIADWIAAWRRGADQFFRGTAHGQDEMEEIFGLVWHSGKPFRDALRPLADSEGYVYLYRTTKGAEVKGAAAVESYTIKPKLNTIGGTSRLYRVHVDNVIGSFGVGSLKEYEILVAAPHHEIVTGIATLTKEASAVRVGTVDDRIGADDLLSLYTDSTETHIKNMLSEGIFSPEEISARTNVTKDAVLAVMGQGHLKDLQAPWRRYTDSDKLDQYISNDNKLFAIRGNPARNQMARAYADLDRTQYSQMQQMETQQFTRASQSLIGNKLLDLVEYNKVLLDKLGLDIAEIGNASVSRPTFQSADQALRKLENGATVVQVGKQFTNQMDQITRELLEPMALPMMAVRNNRTQLIEFNQVYNKLLSLAGWRDIILDDVSGKWIITQKNAKGEIQFVTKADGTPWFIQQKEVAEAINATREPARQLLYTHNLNRKLRGQAPLNDLGLYLPPINIVNHNYAFVIDRVSGTKTQLLVANTADELESQIQAYSRANGINEKGIEVLRKGNQEADLLARTYSNGDMYVSFADVAQRHEGTASLAILPSDERLIENLITGFQTSILQSGRSFLSHNLRGTVDWLDHLSYFNQRNVRDQPKRGLLKDNVDDAALTVKNVLIGRDQIGQHAGIQAANNYTEFLINSAARIADNTWNSLGKDTRTHKDFFENLNRDLRSAGITEPIYGSFDLYLASTIREARNVAPSIVSGGNGMVATLGLRMLDVANAAVNIMSMPIMTWGALMDKVPTTVIGNSEIKLPLRVMTDGMRWMNSPQAAPIIKTWEEKGLIDQTLRQYDEVTTLFKRASLSKNASDQAAAAMHDFINNKGFVGKLSTASDWAERATRKYAMSVGYTAAKRAYPGIDDAGATVAAMQFADRIVGNYHAAQRPTIFQGTLGAAIGLYQTYMLTFAQQVYRGLENRNFRQLSGLMLTQAGIFGMKGLPGYNVLSEQIVSQFNDNNWDLTTGTYRAFGDSAAELILYGLPSSITGSAFYTRGDITPRVPSTTADLALVNGVRQGLSLVGDIIGAIGTGMQDGNVSRNLLEALSLQSLNRPIARWSELLTGSSQTRQGNTVSTYDEVWTPISAAARAIGTRPLQEQVVREAIHLNRFYESRDHDNRQKAMERIKTSLRGGDLDDATLSDVSEKYLREGGNAKGWQMILNETLARSGEGARMDLLRKLEPDSPLNSMIRDMY